MKTLFLAAAMAVATPTKANIMSDPTVEILQKWLETDEGVRSKPYKCSANKWTIGIGHNFEDKPLTVEQQVRYFNRHPMDAEDIRELFEDDIAEVLTQLRRFDWFKALTPVRQAALANMAFQMGVEGLFKFVTTLTYVQQGDFERAASNMLNSKWARQTPARARRVAQAIQSGEVPV